MEILAKRWTQSINGLVLLTAIRQLRYSRPSKMPRLSE
jgi:hypothetical protein